MESINNLRGTYDILPGEIEYWHYIESKAQNLFEQANYSEIRTPILEFQDLFERGVGQGTDIVNKEMYSFQDKGKRYITLRPEGTAGIARSFIQHKVYASNKIQKFWYKGPMFRYERPQLGRQRQFTQLGIEVIGSKNSRADAEVISIAFELLNRLELRDFNLEINSIGQIDNRKQYETNLVQYLNKYYNDLDEDTQHKLKINPLRILDTKDIKTQEILENAPQINDFLDDNSRNHFITLCKYLDTMSIPYSINYNLVRGLDYYNDTAFEFKTKELGSQDTICGGGRYDKLIKILGGPEVGAIGWAIGMERLLAIIKNKIQISKKEIDFYIISENTEETKLESMLIFQQLINKKHKVILNLDDEKLQKQLKKGSDYSAKFCIIVKKDENEQKQIIQKNMQTGEQKLIKKENISYSIN